MTARASSDRDAAARDRDAAARDCDAARFQAFDLLATLLAVVDAETRVRFANAALEDALGSPRRSIEGSFFAQSFAEPHELHRALETVLGNRFATLRYDALLLSRPGRDALAVHVVVAQGETPGEAIVELLPQQQQSRQEREQRLSEQARATRELIRNLAHEIKNPLGGIRGAAQLLEMEVARNADLGEYARVIVHEADRLQSLVDRLLAPHRKPHVTGDVNIHEVCEHVRSLVGAEHPRGLELRRDYDVSIPEFRGDREQLIQALLNLVQNAAHALGERIAAGDARIILRTRVARQQTFNQRRYRLALELHVIDNGPGVPEAIRDRLFFPLVSGRAGGSGLGLTLAQDFVAQHDGAIECESAPGCTDFKLLIPLP